MEDTTSKIFLKWSDIQEYIEILSLKILTDYPNIDSVMGIPRGGLIPAVMISHELGIPLVIHPTKNTLVIDDINDTGYTLDKAPGVYHAVLHHKPTSKFKPNFYAEEAGEEWIVYPWEKEDSEALPDYFQSNEFLEFAEGEDNSVVWPEEDNKLHTIGGLTMPKENTNKLNKNE